MDKWPITTLMLLALVTSVPSHASAQHATTSAPIPMLSVPSSAPVQSSDEAEGGLFANAGWARLGFSATDGIHPGGELAWARMLSRIVEFRSEISTVKRTEGALPGIENIGSMTSPGNFATEGDPVWDFSVMGVLSFYVVEPQGDLPLGIHIGGFGDWTRYLGSFITSPADYQNLSYGGEVGGFYRGRSGNVVRAAVQIGQIQYRSDMTPVKKQIVNVLVGVEPKVGSIRLGAYGGQRNDQRFIKAAIIF